MKGSRFQIKLVDIFPQFTSLDSHNEV
jgi:hypothetical protein